jgi:multidrug resistance protein, MATE family
MSQPPKVFTGGLREFFNLLLPIALMTFSNCLFLFVEKLFLARLSKEAMEAAVNVAYMCQIFQAPCVALAMMAQVFVGRWHGAREDRLIGPGIWQFIWFSLLSMLITLPISYLYGINYLRGTELEGIAMPYFCFLISINFLYPLASTLSCFYLGLGKTRLVVMVNVGTQVLKLCLAYLLIFGWGDLLPSLGLYGGALSTLIAQASCCLVLFGVFLNKKHAQIYNSRAWLLRLSLFWQCLQPGLLRAMNRIVTFTCWAAIARLMTAQGGDFLLILSVGGAIFLFIPFFADAVCQTSVTIVSQIIGAEQDNLLGNAMRSGAILVAVATAFLAIPFLLFPMETFAYLFPKLTLSETQIRALFLGLWLCSALFTFSSVPLGYILAFKNTSFLLVMGCLQWVYGFGLMYGAMVYLQLSASLFWIVLALMHGCVALAFLMQALRLRSKAARLPQPSAT